VTLKLEWILFFFLLLPLSVIIALWVSSGKARHEDRQADKAKVLECEICCGVYRVDNREEISKCPLCGSYNKIDKASF
jgi:rubrerythrin